MAAVVILQQTVAGSLRGFRRLPDGLFSGFNSSSSSSCRQRSSRFLRIPRPVHSSPREQGIGIEALQEVNSTTEKAASVAAETSYMMKLFNDAQQNMLFLNQQRLMAMEELQKVENDKKLLLAQLAQLEAENQAGLAECDVLRTKLQQLEVSLLISENQGESLRV
jgi:cysteinyl-tRNA synthetase